MTTKVYATWTNNKCAFTTPDDFLEWDEEEKKDWCFNELMKDIDINLGTLSFTACGVPNE